jgi:NADH dehydrogenase/NADH:ubiquinone oxidoreductase subunit G
VQLAVPFGHRLDEGLTKVAAECVAACPTGALSLSPDAMSSSPAAFVHNQE